VGHPIAVDLDLTRELGCHRETAGSGDVDLDAELFEIFGVDADHALVAVTLMIILDPSRNSRLWTAAAAGDEK